LNKVPVRKAEAPLRPALSLILLVTASVSGFQECDDNDDALIIIMQKGNSAYEGSPAYSAPRIL
jgi:hypothetical protein